jgi:glycosyl transferase, family 25
VRTFVINLPRSPERREHMEQQLQYSGLDYQFIDAVDGASLTDEQRSQLVDENRVAEFPKWLTPSAIGCALSHKRAYDLLIAEDVPHALVLEDDARLSPRLAETVAQLAPELRADEVMLLYFRSFGAAELRRTDAVTAGGHQILRPAKPTQIVSTVAYLIGRDAAASLSAACAPVRRASDTWHEFLAIDALGTLRCVLPRPVEHSSHHESTSKQGDQLSTRHRVSAAIPRLRDINRSYVDRRMTRVKFVD